MSRRNFQTTRYRGSYLHIDLVSAKNDGDMFADALKITMPVGHVLIGNARCHVEHDDTALALDVITIAETTELLLSCGIPYVEDDGTKVGEELQWVNFHTESS